MSKQIDWSKPVQTAGGLRAGGIRPEMCSGTMPNGDRVGYLAGHGMCRWDKGGRRTNGDGSSMDDPNPLDLINVSDPQLTDAARLAGIVRHKLVRLSSGWWKSGLLYEWGDDDDGDAAIGPMAALDRAIRELDAGAKGAA